MKIYTKNATTPHVISVLPILMKHFYDVYDCQFEDDDVFYYDRHDLALRRIQFNTFIDSVHWEHIKTHPNTKILINFSDDYLNILDIERIAQVLIKKEINPQQVFFLVMDDNFKDFVVNEFQKRNLFGINVQSYNVLLKYININKKYSIDPTHKFSLLSRNYFPWRLSILLGLLNKDVLNHFNYSFHNFIPYAEEDKKIVSLDRVKTDIQNLGYELTPKINEWVSNVPYDLGNRQSKWNDVTYEAILSGDFHVLIESHYDAFLFDNFSHFRNSYKVEEFSPGFPTEKTWKAIFCKKPFIVAAAPYFLKDLKKMGFKSFSPYIDESYDNEENNDIRSEMIINEVSRICNLPQDEYENLKQNLIEICEHNYNVLRELHKKIKFENEFFWINQLSK